jgi:acetyl esterase/lipase
VSASVGSVFAELRQDDRVVAVDADTAFGKLGSRIDPKAQGSYWELASDPHLDSFADVRARVWIHGGCYVIGSASQDDKLCHRFARALGIMVASVEYRVAPEHPYPAATR